MTVKELAEFTGKESRTIRRWIQKVGERNPDINEKVRKAHRTKCPMVMTVDEVEQVLTSGSMSKDAVRILMENARKPIQTLELVSTPNQMDVLLTFMAEQQQVNQKFMAAVMSELKGFKNQTALPEPVKEDYYSLAAYCAIKGMKINRSEMAIHGKELKKTCGAYGSEIHKIPDERWGKVNSYPVEILDEYFSV